jgi:LPXTG-motif cell wall-anchored protein
MGKVNQGGSALSFVIIGIILVLLLVGGTYFVRQRLLVQADNGRQTTDTPQTKPSDKTDTPEESKKEEPTKTPETSQPVQPDSTAQDTAAPPAANLPQTGPAETLSVILGAAFLTAALAAYMRSRRDYVSL